MDTAHSSKAKSKATLLRVLLERHFALEGDSAENGADESAELKRQMMALLSPNPPGRCTD